MLYQLYRIYTISTYNFVFLVTPAAVYHHPTLGFIAIINSARYDSIK